MVVPFFQFKQLMLKLDPDDPDLLDEDEKPNSVAGTPVKQTPAASASGHHHHHSMASQQHNHTADGTSNNVHVNNVNSTTTNPGMMPVSQQNVSV